MVSRTWLTSLSAAGSLVVAGLLLATHFVFSSDLALAQAADSLMDVGAATLLAFTAKVGSQPSDERHPFGHSRAEPLGALGIAVLAAALGLEVEKSAIESLVAGSRVEPEFPLLAVFLTKVLLKGGIFLGAFRRTGAVFEALAADAKNDLLVGAVAVVGFVGARFGMLSIDAWLSIPVGIYIALAGFRLARENVDRLMGVAPPESRLAELRKVVEAVAPEVRFGVTGHLLGSQLQLEVILETEGGATVAFAHEIAEHVRRRLEEEEDVVHVAVRSIPRADS